ncbi:hypothetical protein CYLTODRAFT_411799 [Cylindrobasidium torrendii FP15055 ss-10]|uniref:Uncharacterized protein n=1 Tax=Cylindrobasidium torrendii FP15055 ss-10 TaxID=1314674 RepID=A0A0D7B8K9_9AGAR|nr:hypothetical protein CYLTODRAFT_411799 [Cylindrobasidium torrendii FP15055 ss-10]
MSYGMVAFTLKVARNGINDLPSARCCGVCNINEVLDIKENGGECFHRCEGAVAHVLVQWASRRMGWAARARGWGGLGINRGSERSTMQQMKRRAIHGTIVPTPLKIFDIYPTSGVTAEVAHTSLMGRAQKARSDGFQTTTAAYGNKFRKTRWKFLHDFKCAKIGPWSLREFP